MRINTRYIVILFLLQIFFFTNSFAEGKRVLFINSYSPEHPTSRLIEYPLKTKLEKEGHFISINYLHYDNLQGEEFNQLLYDQYSFKLKHEDPYDLIIVASKEALEFILKYQEELFEEIPILFTGIHDVEYGFSQDNNTNVTGIVEKIALEELIDLIHKIQPDINEVIAIGSDNPLSKYQLKRFNDLNLNYSHTKFSNINTKEYSKEELINLISAYKTAESAIVLLSYYNDIKGNNINFKEGLESLVSNIEAPIYQLWMPGLRSGVMGGIAYDITNSSKKVATIALEILNGKSISEFKVENNSEYLTYLNLKIIDKFNLSKTQIPKETILLNKPKSNFNVNIKTITTTLVIILILIALLSFTLYVIFIRRKFTKELQNSNDKYTSLFNNSPDIIVILDTKSHKIHDINDKGCSFLKASKTELLGYSATKIFPEEYHSAIENRIKNHSEHFNSKPTEMEIIDSAKQKVAVDIISELINIQDKNYLQVVIHDIAYIKKTENELRSAKDKAEESDKLKSAFLANMSHEIRTPMNAISGFSSLIAQPGVDFITVKNYNHIIQNNCQTLIQLIDDIIDIAKIESGQITLKYSDVNISQLFEELKVVFEKELLKSNKKTIKLKYSLDKSVNIIHSDALRLRQIISNLIGNAIKFTEFGYIEFGCKKINGSKIRFFVKDTGIGISDNNLTKIFNRFEKLQDQEINAGGTGLGLTISKNLVQLLNGNIGVKSLQEKGSLFHFTLPI